MTQQKTLKHSFNYPIISYMKIIQQIILRFQYNLQLFYDKLLYFFILFAIFLLTLLYNANVSKLHQNCIERHRLAKNCDGNSKWKVCLTFCPRRAILQMESKLSIQEVGS